MVHARNIFYLLQNGCLSRQYLPHKDAKELGADLEAACNPSRAVAVEGGGHWFTLRIPRMRPMGEGELA